MLSAHSTNKFKELNTKNERKKIRQTHLQRLGDFFPVFFYTNTSRSPITKISDFSALIKLRQMEFMRERCSFIKFYIDGTLNERQQCAPAKSMQLCKFFINLAQHKRKQRQKIITKAMLKMDYLRWAETWDKAHFSYIEFYATHRRIKATKLKGITFCAFFILFFDCFKNRKPQL